MSHSPDQLLHGLRAIADASRLRLVALLALGEFAVGELTELVGQSQPRVSRHLRLLAEAGMLERFREQHWVFYRLAADGEGAEVARTLLALLDRDDPQLVADRERATALRALRAATQAPATGGGPASADAGELAAIVGEELAGRGYDSVLYAGPSPTEVLRVLAPRARRALGLSSSRAEVQRARASLHGAGLAHCVLQSGDLQTRTGVSARFDVVVLDRCLDGEARAELVLADAARALRPGGRVVLVEDYDVLAARAAAGNPLALLRDWLARGGLLCSRVRPVDTGARHLLVATAEYQRDAAAA